MFSRRWEPGIGTGDWIGPFRKDQGCATAYQGCISGRWGFDFGIRKGMGGILRKIKIGIEGRRISAITTTDCSINTVQGLMEKHDEPFDDIEMEIEAINAAMMASGVDLEAEEEFQTLSEEEFEQDSEAQIEKVLLQNAEEPVAGDAHINKELGTGEVATRQGHRKRLFKPNNSTAGSTKMRMASALLSPRKKTAAAAAKVGTRHGDNTKPPESKGPSIPKPVNLKF
ncbi:hypothetical protein HID58_039555 [Brassica napus]|uniref:Uncharacterized protein n=1 Tax=Brassica napus TaxID=3708 RepID=A0ABQ8BSL4_BRANA|nr:hypothetical protein HID58_039555 [Brassica napus]